MEELYIFDTREEIMLVKYSTSQKKIYMCGNKNLLKIRDNIGTSINIHSDGSDLVEGKMDIVSQSYKGNLLPNLTSGSRI